MPTETSAGAVIFKTENNERKYLLLHYESGHWDFVKGKIEKKEKEEDTVIREAKEEAGITRLNFIKGFKEKIQYFFKQENKTIFKEVIFLLAETDEKEIKISHEHIGYKWLNHKNALKQLTYKNAQEILKKAELFLMDYDKQKKINNF